MAGRWGAGCSGCICPECRFAVTLSGVDTHTLAVMLRMAGLEAKGAKRIESAPEAVILDALARVQTLFD